MTPPETMLSEDPAARQRLAREPELPADLHRQEPAHQQEKQADEQKLDTDDLVVGREDVLAPEASSARDGLRSECERPSSFDPPAACWATQALYSSACARTHAPASCSVHPAQLGAADFVLPVFVAWNQAVMCMPGTASCFTRHSGTKNE